MDAKNDRSHAIEAGVRDAAFPPHVEPLHARKLRGSLGVRKGAMETNQVQAVIEKGFNDLRAEMSGKFGRIDGQFADLRAEVNGKFGEIDGQFDDLRAEMNEKFGRIDGQFAELRRDVNKAGDDAHLAHVAIENLRHDLSIFDEGESSPLEARVSALEVRVTKLARSRTKKKSGTEAESRKRS